MAAPEYLVTQAELENAVTAEKVRQLLPAAGRKAADPERVNQVLSDATGAVLGQVRKALKGIALDTWWDAPTTTARDKAELKRLAKGAAVYYLHFHGLKAEELTEAQILEMERIEMAAKAIGDHYATIGANDDPDTATQNELVFTMGAGRSPAGSPRSRWKNF